MEKQRIIQRITASGVVPIVRVESAQQAKRMADACLHAGVQVLEVACTVPGAYAIIGELAKAYSADELLIGAGMVFNPESASMCLLSGAQYVGTPCLDMDIAELCNQYQVPCMVSAATLNEVVDGAEAGFDVLKIIPSGVLGPWIVKTLKASLPQTQVIAAGAVGAVQIETWIKAGCIAIEAGSLLMVGAEKGNYALVTEAARQLKAEIDKARQ